MHFNARTSEAKPVTLNEYHNVYSVSHPLVS